MPVIGVGTWQLTDDTAGTLEHALRLGYRMLDTSGDYGTEAGVGDAIRRSRLDRSEIFVVTKVEEDEDAFESTWQALRELRLDHVDLVLVHRPPPRGAGEALWEGLLRARDAGLARDIGVSNYSIDQIERLVDATAGDGSRADTVAQLRKALGDSVPPLAIGADGPELLAAARGGPVLVVHAGEAQLVAPRDGAAQPLFDFRRGRFRDMAGDEQLRVVDQHSGGFAVVIAHDASSGRIRRIARDPARVQCRAVQPHRVPVDTIEVDRVRFGGGEIPPGGKVLHLPVVLVPAAAVNPRPRDRAPLRLAYACRALRGGGGLE